MKKTDLEKNKAMKLANSMKQAGANRAGSTPQTQRQKAGGNNGLLGKLLGKAVPPEKSGN